jgi:hypothetical protein
MTPEEIAEALEIPWYKIVEFASKPSTLQELLTLALGKGYQCGKTDLAKDYNKAFRGYTETSIKEGV